MFEKKWKGRRGRNSEDERVRKGSWGKKRVRKEKEIGKEEGGKCKVNA